jgi:putative peptide zinc metalloprotease protein
MEDPFLQTELKRLDGRLHALRAEHESLVNGHQQVRAEILQDEIGLVEKEIAQRQAEAERLTLRSPAEGTFVVQQPGDLPGRFLRQGDLIGYVLDERHAEVRVAVSQEAIGQVRHATQAIEARYANRPAEPVPVRMMREIPESRQRLPSPALGSLGGGEFTLHPEDRDGTRPLEAVFELRLQLDRPMSPLGERIIVHFEHQPLPLGWQWYRSFRQMFLKRFNL